jgi:predicted dehydrogenase
MLSHRTIGIGIIGCGDAADTHARTICGDLPPAIRPGVIGRIGRKLTGAPWPQPVRSGGMDGVRITAACDNDPRRLAAFAGRYGVSGTEADYVALLDRADVDAVVICTPPSAHADITIAAARRGKHVLCEKPLATTSRQGRAMIEAADAAGIVLQIGYVLRYSAERGAVRQAILDGRIGRPVFYREVFNLCGGPTPRWVLDERVGAGTLWENSHILDFLRYTFGEPATVAAVGGKFKPGDTTALDTFGVLLSWESGDRALFTDSYAMSGFGWDRRGCRKNQFQLDVIGPGGYIQYPETDHSPTLTIGRYREGGDVIEQSSWTSDWGADGYRAEVEQFIECVRTGGRPRCAGGDALRTLELAETIVRAARTGQSCDMRVQADGSAMRRAA